MPFDTPMPPSPDTSAALLEAFAERGIDFVGGRRVAAFDATRHVAVLEDGDELPCDLFLGVPKHRAPRVVLESGIAVDGYIPVESRTLQTRIPGIYALGDVATIGVPKAGVFSEGAARVVAETIIARRAGGEPPEGYDGRGACYAEFGDGHVQSAIAGASSPTSRLRRESASSLVQSDGARASSLIVRACACLAVHERPRDRRPRSGGTGPRALPAANRTGRRPAFEAGLLPDLRETDLAFVHSTAEMFG